MSCQVMDWEEMAAQAWYINCLFLNYLLHKLYLKLRKNVFEPQTGIEPDREKATMYTGSYVRHTYSANYLASSICLYIFSLTDIYEMTFSLVI